MDLAAFQQRAKKVQRRTREQLIERYTAEEWIYAALLECEPGDIRRFFAYIDKHPRGITGAVCGPQCRHHNVWDWKPKPPKQLIRATERIYNNGR